MTPMSFAKALKWWEDQDGAAPAVTCGSETITRRQLGERSNRLARAYRELGVRHGSYVVIELPNSIEFIVATVAALKLGAVLLPISRSFARTDKARIFSMVQPALVIGGTDEIPGGHAVVPEGFAPPADLSDDALPDVVSKPWFATTSSGSSGTPKLIVNAEAALISPTEPQLHLAVDRSILIPSPLYHGGPFHIGVRGLFWGNHIVVMERFDAETLLQQVDRHRIDYLPTVPTMMSRILRLGPEAIAKYELSSLRIVVSLGAACPAWLKEEWIALLGAERVHEFYSCTEQLGLTWITGPQWLEHRGSVGRSFTGGQIRIFDENGDEAPPGKIGEIYMIPASGPGTSYTYIGAQPRRRPDGWETVGDLGWLDEDGYLYIADRRTDMIVTGGANVFPAEVEAAIDEFPGVRASAVIGLPDDDLGHRVHAVVEADAGLDIEALRAWCMERLLRYKVPRTFELSGAPVRNEAGKVSRRALREARMDVSMHAAGAGKL